MIVADTSVAVAAALPWHEAHPVARSALTGEKTRVIAQVAIETYSVLTRLPPPQRVPAAVARDYLVEMFELPPIVLAAEEYEGLLDLAVAAQIAGGAVYDAIVAASARRWTQPCSPSTAAPPRPTSVSAQRSPSSPERARR